MGKYINNIQIHQSWKTNLQDGTFEAQTDILSQNSPPAGARADCLSAL